MKYLVWGVGIWFGILFLFFGLLCVHRWISEALDRRRVRKGFQRRYADVIEYRANKPNPL